MESDMEISPVTTPMRQEIISPAQPINQPIF